MTATVPRPAAKARLLAACADNLEAAAAWWDAADLERYANVPAEALEVLVRVAAAYRLEPDLPRPVTIAGPPTGPDVHDEVTGNRPPGVHQARAEGLDAARIALEAAQAAAPGRPCPARPDLVTCHLCPTVCRDLPPCPAGSEWLDSLPADVDPAAVAAQLEPALAAWHAPDLEADADAEGADPC